MISYSVSLSLIMVSVIFLAGSVDLVHVMTTQTGISFGIALLPIAILFMISAIAETNRAPFDLPEAESELVAGFVLGWHVLDLTNFLTLVGPTFYH